ncbi:MAG: redoxin family protein [Bacteroidales bacterium]
MNKSITKFFIICFTLLFLTNIAPAQDGIRFEKGSWKEVLEKARSEKKLVFVDVYTEWCGPCKQMVKDIFPKKSVGDIFNSSFINYKIDAEKGEGVAIAKSYGVKGYPTYLFVNGDGILFYSSMGSMSEDKFLKEAQNALNEFNDPQPFAIMKSQYDNNKDNREFLLKYMDKCRVRGISYADVIDRYIVLLPNKELMDKAVLSNLLKSNKINVDGDFFRFLYENRVEAGRVMGHSGSVEMDRILARYANNDLERAIELKSEELLSKIITILVEFNTEKLNPDWVKDETLMKYYTSVANEAKLKEVIKRYGTSVAEFDKGIIAKGDSISLERFEKSLKSGYLTGKSETEIAVSRKLAKMESVNYGFRLRNIAQSALKGINDKEILNNSLKWIDLAYSYFDNFTITEVKAGLLFKLGRVDEAVEFQKKAIDDFDAMKMVNEPIRNRLLDQLKKMEKSAGSKITSDSGKVTIKGDLGSVPDQEVIIEKVGPNGQNKVLQTTKSVNGKFELTVNLENSPALLNFKLQNKRVRFMSNDLGMSSGNGNIFAESNHNIDIAVTGTPPGDTSQNFMAKLEVVNDSPSFQRVLSLRKYLNDNFDTPMSNIMKQIQGLNIDWSKNPKVEELNEDIRTKLLDYRAQNRKSAEAKRDYIISYVRSNPSDFCSVFLLFELSYSPLPFTRAEELWQELYSGLSEEVKGTHVCVIYKSFLDKKENSNLMTKSVSVGKSFKDFTLKDVKGNDVKMSSCLSGKKYILLDFWASWCGPCRAENPNVLKAYNKFHDKGFDVVAVSLDESKDQWISAIKKDNMPWIHLSDLKGWKSEVAGIYGVSAIPASFLLDSNGVIVATNLRGEKLEEKLSELLK